MLAQCPRLAPANVIRLYGEENVGTAGAQFLRIPVGARAVALGKAYSACATDGSAPLLESGGHHAHAGPAEFLRQPHRVHRRTSTWTTCPSTRAARTSATASSTGILRSGRHPAHRRIPPGGHRPVLQRQPVLPGRHPGPGHDRPLLHRRHREVLPGEPGRVPDRSPCWPTWASSTSWVWATCASVSRCAISAAT